MNMNLDNMTQHRDFNEWYITQKSLYEFIKNNCNEKIYSEFPKRTDKEHFDLATKYWITKFTKKYDIALEKNWKLHLIEFDWIYHFSSEETCRKDTQYRNWHWSNISVHEIPFFIQLNDNTVKEFLPFIDSVKEKRDAKWHNLFSFPSWFWSFDAVHSMSPSTFCNSWYRKYLTILEKLDEETKEQIRQSLLRWEFTLWLSTRDLFYNEVFLSDTQLETIRVKLMKKQNSTKEFEKNRWFGDYLYDIRKKWLRLLTEEEFNLIKKNKRKFERRTWLNEFELIWYSMHASNVIHDYENKLIMRKEDFLKELVFIEKFIDLLREYL